MTYKIDQKIPVIDRGIPIPEKRQINGEILDLALAMEPGDSVFFPELKRPEKLRYAIAKCGGKGLVRKVEEGYRCWRIK